MFAARFLIFGLPLIAGLVAWWSAAQARLGRVERRTHLVALLPQQELGWNPFERMTEGERQILDVVHEPLLRIHRDGSLVPALAERWAWSQRVSCWFADEKTAAVAARRLSALRGNEWAPWHLESARPAGTGLTLKFSAVAGEGAAEAMKAIDDLEPERARILRMFLPESGRVTLSAFRKTRAGAQIKRVWWDDERSGELLIVGDPKDWAEEFEAAFREAGIPPPDLRVMGELKGLREPVLEFVLREGVRWHSGDRVVPEDVRATVEWVKESGWQAGLEEGLRDVQRVEVDGETGVRVIYRNFYGPAVCDWVSLPILPGKWIAKHRGKDFDRAFSKDPPPGAGPFQLSRLDDRVLALSAVPRPGPEPLQRQVRILTGAGPFVMHMAFATGGADLAWQGQEEIGPVLADESLVMCSSPPRGRLLVLWNTRAPVVGDVRLRKALALATDREALVDGLLNGRGRVSEGLFQPGLWYAGARPAEPFDRGRAQRLLAEGGWLVDVGGVAKRPDQALQFNLITTAGAPERERLAELLRDQWAKIGADVRVEVLPPEVWAGERLPRGQFDGVILGMDYPVSWDQSKLWHSGELPPGGLNYSGVADAQVDLLLDALAVEFDPDRVTDRASQLEERVLSKHPMLTLFADRQDMVVRKELLPADLAQDPDVDCTLRDLLLLPEEVEVRVESLEMRTPKVEVPAPRVNPKMRVPEE